MILCGWCGQPTEPEGVCTSCGRSPRIPYEQRGQQPTQAADPVRERLLGAYRAIRERGDTVTVARIAEELDVSDRTVRRWQQMSDR